MKSLSLLLENFLAQRVGERIASADPGGRVQPILIAPSQELLDSLWSRLTQSGGSNWNLKLGDAPAVKVAVILIEAAPPAPAASMLSARATWDYAVAIRNSGVPCLVLASSRAWDASQESIVQASEQLWLESPGTDSPRYPSEDFWSAWAATVGDSEHAGCGESRPRLPMDLLQGASSAAKPGLKGKDEERVWQIAEAMLGARSEKALIARSGLFEFDPTEKVLDVAKRLDKLASACKLEGLEATRANLQGAARAEPAAVAPAVDDLFDKLSIRAGTGAELASDWSKALSNDGSEQWWNTIPHKLLRKLMIAAGIEKPEDKISLSLANELLNKGAAKAEIKLIRGAPRIEVNTPLPEEIRVDRITQGKKDPIARAANGQFIDVHPLLPSRPTRYRATQGPHVSDLLHVVDIESVASPAIVWAGVGSGLELPQREDDKWIQLLRIARPGRAFVSVFVPIDASRVTASVEGGTEDLPLADGIATLNRQVEGGETIQLVIYRGDARRLELELQLDVAHAVVGAAPGYLEALMSLHISKKEQEMPLVQSARTKSRDAERILVEDPASWSARFGGWTSDSPEGWGISIGERQFGDLIIPASQVRATLEASPPPTALVESRMAVQAWIVKMGLPIAELDLGESEPRSLLQRYLTEYVDWLRSDPVGASWIDLLAIFGAFDNDAAAGRVPSRRPVAVLLGPLHPLRLAWLSSAQRLLAESTHLRCPLAGELGVFSAPSSMALPLGVDPVTREPDWQGFYRAPTDSPLWHLMWNHAAPSAERAGVAGQLLALGISASVATPGMDSTQVSKALDDVAFLSPSRSALRLGLLGTGASRSSATAALDWVERKIIEASEEQRRALNPRQVDVIDFRGAGTVIEEDRISDISDRSDGALRWYSRGGGADRAQVDILIVEGVGEEKTRSIPSTSRSTCSPGVHFRIDPARAGADKSLIEPRCLAPSSGTAGGFEDKIQEASFLLEDLAATKGRASHIVRSPPSVANRLKQAKYVALGSNEVDPSLLAAAVREEGGLIWDYELPVPIEPLKSSSGYYLLARTTAAQELRVKEALKLVLGDNAPVDPSGVLAEISLRGIPLLRRFAAGGSSARGELGLFLAVRLLQGAVGATNPVLPPYQGGRIRLLVSVDSYVHFVERLKEATKKQVPKPAEKMPDLLLVDFDPSGTGVVRLVPIEVKFRGQAIEPQHQLRTHLSQASSLGSILHVVFGEMSVKSALWREASRAWLARVINHAFRVYSTEGMSNIDAATWTDAHQQCIANVLSGTATIGVDAPGRLLMFDLSTDSELLDVDGDRSADTLRVGMLDSRKLINAEADTALREMTRELFEHRYSAPGAKPAQAGQRTEPAKPTPPDAKSSAASNAAEDVSPIDAARMDVAKAFEGFIGNVNVIERISRDLIVALVSEPRALSKSFLFHGPPSSGKTELCRRIARALDLPFIPLDGTALKSRDKLIELVDTALDQASKKPVIAGQLGGLPVVEYPSLVIFVDEVHLVNRSVQESFLTALEPKDRKIHLGSRYAYLPAATFLFATTRPTGVDAALRTRCDEVTLSPYSSEEVAEMLALAFPGLPESIYLRLSVLGRRIPRVALRMASDLKAEAFINPQRGTTEAAMQEHLDKIKAQREVDEDGVGPAERHYLRVLHAKQGGPLGLESIQSHMPTVPPEAIETEIEPFLLQEGLIEFTSKGRRLTSEGSERAARNFENPSR